MTFFSWLPLISLLFSPVSLHAQETDDTQASFEALVTNVEPARCGDETLGCSRLSLTGGTGEFEGRAIEILTDPRDDLGGIAHAHVIGDRVIVQTQEIAGERQYFISDVVRRGSLTWLFALFAAAIVAFGGIGALRSFVGMAASFCVLFLFIIPRILAGDSPMTIALIGSLAIMLLTFALCHGRNKKTYAALLGTLGSLVLTALLAAAFSAFANLTGTADEEMLFLLQDFPHLNARGIVLAGIVIGSLGVLDDVTIAQASAVFELKRANPLLRIKDAYRRAHRIGADHIAAAVNTLVLAYAGASLPLMLLLVASPAGESWSIFINREMIATEIVRTLVGSIGLLAAVPLTTIIAVFFASRGRDSSPSRHGHVH